MQILAVLKLSDINNFSQLRVYKYFPVLVHIFVMFDPISFSERNIEKRDEVRYGRTNVVVCCPYNIQRCNQIWIHRFLYDKNSVMLFHRVRFF
jgi:hypothetical protein